MDYRKKLIEAGVKNLKQFGYPRCTAENILTDAVYKAFFRRMLEDDGNVTKNREVEAARTGLLAELG